MRLVDAYAVLFAAISAAPAASAFFAQQSSKNRQICSVHDEPPRTAPNYRSARPHILLKATEVEGEGQANAPRRPPTPRDRFQLDASSSEAERQELEQSDLEQRAQFESETRQQKGEATKEVEVAKTRTPRSKLRLVSLNNDAKFKF